jgi:hypothetical protein
MPEADSTWGSFGKLDLKHQEVAVESFMAGVCISCRQGQMVQINSFG